MSTYAIGDIHGCRRELSTLLETLYIKENVHPKDDTLVFVGDYVDRGPDSKGVIDRLIELSQIQRCVFLMGNHEDMMLWWLGIDHGRQRTPPSFQRQLANVWFPNGGSQTLISYGIDILTHPGMDEILKDIPENHIEFLKGLQYYYIDGSNLYVHAGVGHGGLLADTPQGAVDASSDENLLWDRLAFGERNNFGTMIYGHTPNKAGVRWNRREEGSPFSVGTDVGCVFGYNPLMAVRIDDWAEIWP